VTLDAIFQPYDINLRTRIKRLVRRTLCFSKTERMHDLVIGLFINRYEFGQPL
jgi:insertion element IS1 protein InsB